MYYCYLESPIGELLLAGDDDALTMIGFPEGAMRRDPEVAWIYNEKPFADAIRQLNEYFAGERLEFDLPLRLNGTEFQLLVLEELQRIPYGETTSYGDELHNNNAAYARQGRHASDIAANSFGCNRSSPERSNARSRPRSEAGNASGFLSTRIATYWAVQSPIPFSETNVLQNSSGSWDESKLNSPWTTAISGQ